MQLPQSLEKQFLALHLEPDPSVVQDLCHHVEVEIRNAVAAERERCAEIAAAASIFAPIEAQERAASVYFAIRARNTEAI